MKEKLLNTISSYLTCENIKHDIKDNYIQSGMEIDDESYTDLVIHFIEEQSIIKIVALNFMEIKKPVTKELMHTILKINYETLLGYFSFDLEEKLVFMIDVTYDKVISDDRFMFCLHALIFILKYYVPIIKKSNQNELYLNEGETQW